MSNFAHSKDIKMKKYAYIIPLLCIALLSSCAAEFNRVYKSNDIDYKYEFAKECFAIGKFNQAVVLLQELVTIQKGTDKAQECLYMLGMAEYCDRDFESASETFKKYFSSYPKGIYAEQACFYIGQSLYQSTPEPRLDQTATVGAINAYQEFIDFFPESSYKERAQQRLYELQDKLILKEYLSAKLYYNLGEYFGNWVKGGSNYDAWIVTAENTLKTYPFTSMREDFYLLIMKSKFELAEQSVEEKRIDRYREAEDECYGFINEFPESKDRATAEKYIAKCKKVTGD